jgi:hypothetical protein
MVRAYTILFAIMFLFIFGCNNDECTCLERKCKPQVMIIIHVDGMPILIPTKKCSCIKR